METLTGIMIAGLSFLEKLILEKLVLITFF